MKKFIWKKRFSLPETIGLISITVISMAAISYAVTVPNTFVADTVISAGEVNANFQALVDAVTTLESQVATLQADLTTVDNRLSTVESNNVLLLDPYLNVTTSTDNELVGPHVIFDGVNLHIRSGGGATDAAINGLGNLLVGYNEEPPILNPGDRGGSHNIILGPEHIYSSYGGFVAGYMNTVSGNYASVSGGFNNDALGIYSSVSGGEGNDAIGERSSVSGGYYNTASGGRSSVSGGSDNTAGPGWYSSVSGGSWNEASGDYSSVSGGDSNTASGDYSSVIGGGSNMASGSLSSVSGGRGNVAGPGWYPSVSGGEIRSAVGDYDWAAGSLWEDW